MFLLSVVLSTAHLFLLSWISAVVTNVVPAGTESLARTV